MFVTFRPIEAQLTHDTDTFGKMDPYLRVIVGGQTFQTDVCKGGSKNPKWDDSFDFPMSGNGSIQVSVWDKDAGSADDLIGDATLNLYQLGSVPNQIEWFDIFHNGSIAGKVAVQINRTQVGAGPQVIIRPVRAELSRDNDTFGKMDTFVELLVEGKEYQTSICYKGGKTPFWNDSIILPMTGDGAIRLVVWDKDDSQNDLVGDANLNLYQLAQQGPQQVYELMHKGKSAGRIFLQVTATGKPF